MPYTIGLTDDQRILREGLRALLRDETDFQIVGEADSPQSLMNLLRQQPEIVVAELSIGGAPVLDALQEWMRTRPEAKLVILSANEDDEAAIGAIRAGAKAYVLKNVAAADFIEALRIVAKGGSYLSPRISDKLLARIQQGTVDAPTKTSPLDGLSPRELQVLRLVAEGKTSKEIAGVLDLGLQTVRSYRKTMMKKLGVSNAPSLTKLAIANGLTSVNGQ